MTVLFIVVCVIFLALGRVGSICISNTLVEALLVCHVCSRTYNIHAYTRTTRAHECLVPVHVVVR